MGCDVSKIFIKRKEWSVCSLLERRHLLQHFSSNQRVRRPFPPSRSCKCDAIICRQTGKLPWKPSVFLSLFFSSPFLSWEFLCVGVSITAALRARRNHLGSLSNPYSCLGGVSQTVQSWRRCTGHKDKTAAPCLKIVQIISSTHVSIEAAVAMETHPPSASSSTTKRETFPPNWAAQSTNLRPTMIPVMYSGGVG